MYMKTSWLSVQVPADDAKLVKAVPIPKTTLFTRNDEASPFSVVTYLKIKSTAVIFRLVRLGTGGNRSWNTLVTSA
jgi:hypothetical protein